MDILLVDPPYAGLKGFITSRGYNIGLTSLAAYINKEGLETGIVMGDLLVDPPPNKKLAPDWLKADVKDLAARQREFEINLDDDTHAIWKRFKDIVNQTKPMAVGISYLTPLKYVVQRLASMIKEIDHDIKIIAGSFHPTFCPEEVMGNPDIDFAIRGEGEIPLLSLVKELKKDKPKLETVPALYYRGKDGQVLNNPGVDLINNLDELPFPARHLVLNCDYNICRVHNVNTARGCPYTCSFCADNRFWSGKVRRRSVSNVIEELKLLKDTYTIDYVDFIDGTFTYDSNYLQAICNSMIDEGLNIPWRCTARFDNLNEDLLRLMKKANCITLYLGFESGSDRMLNLMNKKTTIEQIIRVNKMIYNSGIISASSVLLGLPDEGQDDIEETLRLMKTIKTDFFDVNSYMPLPGAPIYDSMSEEDIKNIDWRKVSLKSFDNYFSKRISRDDFNRYLAEAYSIANKVRKRTLVRLGARMLLPFLARKFIKLWKRRAP